MTLGIVALLLFLPQAGAAKPRPQARTFIVKHKHWPRDENGVLTISSEGIEFRPSNGGHNRVWTYDDIREISIETPEKIRIETYENRKRDLTKHRYYTFVLLDGRIGQEMSRLLVENAARPPVTSVIPVSLGSAAFDINVKHLHTFGGCDGILKIYPNYVVYQSSDRKSDSRFWRYSDIQNFGVTDRYRLEFTTYEGTAGGLKSYNFELKRDLPAGAYEYIWQRVHPTAFTPLRDAP